MFSSSIFLLLLLGELHAVHRPGSFNALSRQCLSLLQNGKTGSLACDAAKGELPQTPQLMNTTVNPECLEMYDQDWGASL